MKKFLIFLFLLGVLGCDPFSDNETTEINIYKPANEMTDEERAALVAALEDLGIEIGK